jgi:hypothetical protein
MKTIKTGMLKKHEDKEYLYVYHDLGSHKVNTDVHYSISKTYYFVSDEEFYNQDEILQDGLDAKDFKDESACLDHIGKLNKEQLSSVEKKRTELESIQKSATASSTIKDLIAFHDEVIGLLLVWFDEHKEHLSEDTSDREISNDALWAIADDMRQRKENGDFETYMDAYRWAEKNMSKKGINITAKKLEKAYHKAKSEGVI